MTENLRKKIDAFWHAQAQMPDKYLATHFKVDNTHDYDYELVKRFTNSKSEVLDLAAGTCIVSSRLAPNVAQVTAVDKYDSFLEECPEQPNMTLIQNDILSLSLTSQFDVVLLLGVITYFDRAESEKIYQKAAELLKPGGHIIIKHQCGVEEDITVDHFSPQLKTHYAAFYRSIETEKEILSLHVDVCEVIDIYPAELNKWDNTHFYAFICKGLTT